MRHKVDDVTTVESTQFARSHAQVFIVVGQHLYSRSQNDCEESRGNKSNAGESNEAPSRGTQATRDSRRERLNNLLANHIRFDSGMRYVFGYGRDGISTFGSANICAVVQTMFERVNDAPRKTGSRKDQSGIEFNKFC